MREHFALLRPLGQAPLEHGVEGLWLAAYFEPAQQFVVDNGVVVDYVVGVVDVEEELGEGLLQEEVVVLAEEVFADLAGVLQQEVFYGEEGLLVGARGLAFAFSHIRIIRDSAIQKEGLYKRCIRICDDCQDERVYNDLLKRAIMETRKRANIQIRLSKVTPKQKDI
jgi:hypothetical protein